jgi:hypothetical protein
MTDVSRVKYGFSDYGASGISLMLRTFTCFLSVVMKPLTVRSPQTRSKDEMELREQESISGCKKCSYSSNPNILITATGGGPASRILVCPQYAITYFDGCQVTVGEGASAGTRCNDMSVSVADCNNAKSQKVVTTNDIDIHSRTGDC